MLNSKAKSYGTCGETEGRRDTWSQGRGDEGLLTHPRGSGRLRSCCSGLPQASPLKSKWRTWDHHQRRTRVSVPAFGGQRAQWRKAEERNGTASLGKKSWAKGAAFLVIGFSNVIQADPFPLGRNRVHRSLFQRRQLGKHCGCFIPSPSSGDTGPVLPGEREPQQHNGKDNPPSNSHTEWKSSHTARMPRQSRLPTLAAKPRRSPHFSWGKADLFYSQKPERFASPGRRLDLLFCLVMKLFLKATYSPAGAA